MAKSDVASAPAGRRAGAARGVAFAALRAVGSAAAIFAVTTFGLFSAAYLLWKPCELSPTGCAFLDCDIDTDGDGIPNREEEKAGRDGYITNPYDPDTDQDGIWDAEDPCPLDPDVESDAEKAPEPAAAAAEAQLSPKEVAALAAAMGVRDAPAGEGDGGAGGAPGPGPGQDGGAAAADAGAVAAPDAGDAFANAWANWDSQLDDAPKKGAAAGASDAGDAGTSAEAVAADAGRERELGLEPLTPAAAKAVAKAAAVAPIAVTGSVTKRKEPASCASGRVKPRWDSDSDGVPDDEERVPGEDGVITDPFKADTDGDGIGDRLDACPGQPGVTTADQPVDTNGDGEPDRCSSGAPLRPRWWERSSLPTKYGCWIGNIATGRSGISEHYQGAPIAELVTHAFYETAILIALSMLLSALTAFPIVAFLHKFRRRTVLTRAVDTSFAFLSVPIVLVGYVLGALINSTTFSVFGTFDEHVRAACTDTQWIRYGLLLTDPQCGGNYLLHLLLPAAVLALGDGNLGHFVRDMSANLEDVSRRGFMRYARARGISPWRVASRYLLLNVAVPALTFLRYRLVFLLSGALVVEVMFARDGLGRLMINAIHADQDVETFLACVLVFLVVVFVIQTVVRVVQVALDRRLAEG